MSTYDSIKKLLESKGIYNKEIMNEVIYAYGKSKGVSDYLLKNSSEGLSNIANSYNEFTVFAYEYLKENNYVTK